MAISTGSTISASDINALKTRIYAEASRRSVSYTTYTNATAGDKATAAFINSLINPMNTINSDKTSTSTVSINEKIYPFSTTFNSALTTFEGTAVNASNSNCKSGCLGLCQGTCTGTCQGCGSGCASTCTGCSGTCSGTCSGCSGTCSGTCSGCSGCSGCGSCGGWQCQWDGDPCAGNCSSYGCSFTGT